MILNSDITPRTHSGWITLIAVVSAVAVLVAAPVPAQTPGSPAQQDNSLEDIIVTARKREESIMRTPVDVQAFTSQQIEDLKIQNFTDLSSETPGLIIATGSLGVGGLVFMRGIGNGDSPVFIDQSVLLNVDGASLSQGSYYKMGLFDVGQIEVMKGPQALFFGKSTSAGIIAVHSADPTDRWESKVTTGYEFNAQELDLAGVLSGPITENLGIRLAAYRNHMNGWMIDANPRDPVHDLPNEYDEGGRLTLKYVAPNLGLQAKMKVFFSQLRNNIWSADRAQRSCAGATVQVPQYSYDNCRISNVNEGGIVGSPYIPGNYTLGSPAFATGDPSPFFRDGYPYTFSDTDGAVLNVDYDISRALTLTSVSAWTQLYDGEAGRTAVYGISAIDIGNRYSEQDYSEELRLTSNFRDGWINFMVGGFFGGSSVKQDQIVVIPPFTYWEEQTDKYHTRTWSEFAQILLTPIDKWELSIGARHTYNNNYFTSLVPTSNVAPSGEQIGVIPRNLTSYTEGNTSPEVTLTYRPNDDWTAFLAYKHGYKGPGFNVNTTAVTLAGGINPFGGEKVKGVEGGMKAWLLDHTLRLTATGYFYRYLGQQVSFVNNVTLVAVIENGDNMDLKGGELSLAYQVPQIQGLTLNAYADYNHAQYTWFPAAPCYGNQPVSAGCIGGAQNLVGRTPYRAPRFTAQWGGEYRTRLTDKYSLGITTNWNYSSAYHTAPELNPTGLQHSYFTIDAGIRFGRLDGPWELAVIGRDLNNAYYAVDGVDGGPGIPGVIADTLKYVARPRQIMLQLTVRPNLL